MNNERQMLSSNFFNLYLTASILDNDKDNEIFLINTLLILKIYRKVKWSLGSTYISSFLNEDCEEAQKKRDKYIIETHTIQPTRDIKETIEEHLKDEQNRQELIDLVDKTLLTIRTFPSTGAEFYNVLHACYISPNKTKDQQVASSLNISISKLYRIKKAAAKMFGLILSNIEQEQIII